MKRRCILFLYAILLVSYFCAVPLNGQHKDGPYDYPIKPGTTKWNLLRTESERREACLIPDSILYTMSTPDLFESCLDYPLLYGYYIFNFAQEGFNLTVTTFNGLQELLKRKDIGSVCLLKYINLNFDSIQNGERGRIKVDYVHMLLAQDSIINKLTRSESIRLLREVYKKSELPRSIRDSQAEIQIIGATSGYQLALMGRILIKENYKPFVKQLSVDKHLQSDILWIGIGASECSKQVLPYVEQFLSEVSDSN